MSLSITVQTTTVANAVFKLNGLTPGMARFTQIMNGNTIVQVDAKNDAGTIIDNASRSWIAPPPPEDDGGWTDLSAITATDATYIYVSSSDGNDTNTGLDSAHPIKTLGAVRSRCDAI